MDKVNGAEMVQTFDFTMRNEMKAGFSEKIKKYKEYNL